MSGRLLVIALESASLVYLTIPWFLFLWGWLKPLPAAIAIGALMLGVIECWRHLRATRNSAIEGSPVRIALTVVSSFLVAVAWAGLSGAGGYGYQNGDWIKHNTVLSDLIERPWPLAYVGLTDRLPGTRPLVYYVAYYLPAAAIGKWAGWPAANDALFVQSLIGATLALLWFAVVVGRMSFVLPIVFVFASGMDLAGHWLFGTEQVSLTDHLEWWYANAVQLSSNTTLLYWTPHQAIAGWILAAMLVHNAAREDGLRRIPFYLALSLLWSPFVTLGLLLLIPAVVGQFGAWHALRLLITPENLIATPVVLLLGVGFFLSRTASIPAASLVEFLGPRFSAVRLLAFLAIEFGVIGALTLTSSRNGATRLRIAWVLLVLSVLPLYHYGSAGDLSMRAAIPLLFLLWVFAARTLLTGPNWSRVLLALALALGSFTAQAEIRRSLKEGDLHVPDREKYLREDLSQHGLAYQYLGTRDSIFFRSLASPLPKSVKFEAEKGVLISNGQGVTFVTALEQFASHTSHGKVLSVNHTLHPGSIRYEIRTPAMAVRRFAVRHLGSSQPSHIELLLDSQPLGHFEIPQGNPISIVSLPTRPLTVDSGIHVLELRIRGQILLDSLALSEQ